jgi:hypothetical protein
MRCKEARGWSPARGARSPELDLEQQPGVGADQAALQALQHHAANPAAALVLEADHGVHQLAILQAVVEPAHAVPAPAGATLVAALAAKGVEGPLPAHIDLLAGQGDRLPSACGRPRSGCGCPASSARHRGALRVAVLGLYCTVESKPQCGVQLMPAPSSTSDRRSLTGARRAGDALVGKAQALGDAEAPPRRRCRVSRRVVTPSVSRLLSAMRSLPPRRSRYRWWRS